MSVFKMRLPDVGEGVAEAELIQWLVAVGDEVTTESVLAEVLTDKATVEVSSPVSGVVTTLHGEPGDVLAVGSDLVEIETGDLGAEVQQETVESAKLVDSVNQAESATVAGVATRSTPETAETVAVETSQDDAPARAHPIAAPAVRQRARSLGLDLANVIGSGPGGRVVHADLDRLIVGPTGARTRSEARGEAGRAVGREEPVRGVRRRIAERLTSTWAQVPHITYVDAVDVSQLEELREHLNGERLDRGVRLTLLPFIARAIAIACAEQPSINAHYDAGSETLTTFDQVDLGVATQTDQGLLVPVIRQVGALGLWDLAAELARVTRAARDGSATREELTGSTITITSLGAIGGLVTTPILNAPEVSIIGVNKIETRPVWRDGAFAPRQMLNLSSSFDHRMIDGWDAATFVQRLRRLLESPALLFIADE
jgi:2-oxoisovalerate dehydrogenase E2 component (dihydrolipoyl transacylase)